MRKVAWLVVILMNACLLGSRVWGADIVTLVTHESKPYAWVDESGHINGMTVDIANLIFQRANIKKNWKLMPSKRAYRYAKTNINTCIFPLQRNQEREADFQWVGPIMINRYAFYTLENSTIELNTLADLKSFKVVTYLGSGLKEYLSGFGIRVIETLQDDMAATMVSLGRANVWAADVYNVPYMLEAQEHKFDEEFIFFTSISAMACHLSMPESLIADLQEELTGLYRTLEIAKIVRRYER
ncbi:substrate-binding periplasmic protein [Litoribrevibacter euphylliae]|uniref:Substrate-binding periplasmic protein n=1 Tax=Litoribrevibacter euphylliae TaxID=1834034 RepID=A0ABV7HK94_9GAMM